MSVPTPSPKAYTKEYYAGIPLELLHRESQVWLSEIAFWRDEIRFFNELIRVGHFLKHHDKGDAQSETVLKNLLKLESQMLNELQNSIVSHEKYLAQLEKVTHGTLLNDFEYKERHHKISEQIAAFTESFREVKKSIFHLEK